MVGKSLLVMILLRVILPLAVILAIVFGVTHFGLKQAYGVGLFESMRIEKDVKQVIAEFMEAGESRDMEAAYACKHYRSSFEEGRVELIERRYDDIFAGYESLTIDRMSWKWGIGIGIEVVVGPADRDGDGDGGGIDSCRAKGVIRYTSGKVLPFDAWMAKENDVWKIRELRIDGHLLILTSISVKI